MNDTAVATEITRIRGLMEESQRFLCGTWQHQVLWGGVGAAGLVFTWWSVTVGSTDAVPAAWLSLLVLGWIGSLLLVRRGARSAAVDNVAGRAFGGIWMGLGVTLTLLATLGVYSGALDPRSLPGVLSVVLGTGYFASGFLTGLRWLTAVGVAWWVGGAVLLFWSEPGALLVMSAMALLLEVGPALALRARERAQPAAA